MTVPATLVALALVAAPSPRRCTLEQSGQATEQVKALGALVSAERLSEARAAWEALRQTPCIRPATADAAWSPLFDSAAASRWWWANGGADWLLAYASGDGRRLVFPPDWPRVVGLEGKPHPLARLLCAPSDAACGSETEPWVRRAQGAFEADRKPPPADVAARCAKQADSKKDAAARYDGWRLCVETKRPSQPRMALGRFLAPKDGWLVIRGRRGHYAFCDELRAYDLATGAAWVAQSCSGLNLEQSGGVDHGATEAKRRATRTVGSAPLEALREAAWMLFLAGEVQGDARPAWSVELPPGLAPAYAERQSSGRSYGLGPGSLNSAQTRLTWSWQGPEGLRLSGEVTWPDSWHAGETYATRLLRAAEEKLAPGCPPAPLPEQLVVGARPEVSRVDAEATATGSAHSRLVTALYEPITGCSADGGARR